MDRFHECTTGNWTQRSTDIARTVTTAAAAIIVIVQTERIFKKGKGVDTYRAGPAGARGMPLMRRMIPGNIRLKLT